MGIVERRLRQKEEVRTSILNAARQMVLVEGWQALSIRKIAEAIEYSVPVIYDHFESKEAIHTEFTREGFEMLGKAIVDAKAKASEPAAQLEQMALAYWEFAFKNKEYYGLMYGVGMPTCDSFKRMPEISIFAGAMKTTLEDLIAKSSTQEANMILKFHTIWSMLHGLVSINLVGNTNGPDELNEMVLRDAVSSFIKSLS